MAETLEILQTRLSALQAAYLKATEARSYGIGDRSKANQDLSAISAEIDKVEKKIARVTRGGIRVRGVSLSDG